MFTRTRSKVMRTTLEQTYACLLLAIKLGYMDAERAQSIARVTEQNIEDYGDEEARFPLAVVLFLHRSGHTND